MTAAPPCLDALVARGLVACTAALAAYDAAAVDRFGSAALGVVDLPDLGGTTRPSPAQIRVAGALLWCREVESTGLLAFLERLVRPATLASFPFDAAAVRQLARYRSLARERPTAAERTAWYGLVFSPPFPEQLDALATELVRWGREPARAKPPDTALQVRREALAHLLSGRVHGAVQYGVGAVVREIEDAMRALRHPGVRRALGGMSGQSAFSVLERHAPRILGRSVEPRAALRKAVSGAALVHWLAGRGALSQGDPALAAAERWTAG